MENFLPLFFLEPLGSFVGGADLLHFQMVTYLILCFRCFVLR